MENNQETCPHRFDVKSKNSSRIDSFCKIIEDKNKVIDFRQQESSECYPRIRYCKCPLGY